MRSTEEALKSVSKESEENIVMEQGSKKQQKPQSERLSRRGLMKRALAVGITGATGSMETMETQASPQNEITAADMAASDRLAGRSYSEADHALMRKSLEEMRTGIVAIRQSTIADGLEPSVRFDPRLPDTRLPGGKSVCRLSRGRVPVYRGDPESLAFLTVTQLSRLIHAGKITSTALTRMYLDRLKRYGPKLHCVVNLIEERALEQARRADEELAAGHDRGPLHGIPWGAKDLLATRGTPTTYGASPYAHQVLDYDATVVKRLEAAGAVLIAKLSMGELAMGDVWFGGLTRNPWQPDKGASGSSAGAGSATAAGLVGFSIGTETLGSIVSPSVVNGVTGLRPTFGRVSRYGAMELCYSMDKIGPMCRGVEDCALILSAIHGPDGLDRTVVDAPFQWDPATPLSRLRVGIDAAAFDAVEKGKDSARWKIYAEALAVVRGMGISLRPVQLPERTEAYGALAEVIIGAEGASAFTRLNVTGGLTQLVQQRADSWPNIFRVGSTIPASDYLQAMRLRRRLQEEIARALHDIDVYITPPRVGPSLLYTNLTGHPTLVTRCGMQNGLPVSLEFTGNLYRESALLRVAFAYERATVWHLQWPDLRGQS